MACEEAKPGAPAQAAVGGSAGGATISFGTKEAAAGSSSVATAGGLGLSSGGFGASAAAPLSEPAVSGSFSFGAKPVDSIDSQSRPSVDVSKGVADPERQSLQFDTVDRATLHKAGCSVPGHIEAGRLLQTPASEWIMTSKSVEIPELGCVIRECKCVEIDDLENSQLLDSFEEGRDRPRAHVIDRMIVRLDFISNELRAIQVVAAAEGDADGG
jgi:hypothetical protein